MCSNGSKRPDTRPSKLHTVISTIFPLTRPAIRWQEFIRNFRWHMKSDFGPEYASVHDTSFVPKYQASCYCGAVRYEVCADPRGRQNLPLSGLPAASRAPPCSGLPFSIKKTSESPAGIEHLRFYNSERDQHAVFCPARSAAPGAARPLPMKDAKCGWPFPHCLISDLVGEIPAAFRPTCHIFYGTHVVETCDDLPKWSGHKNHSQRL